LTVKIGGEEDKRLKIVKRINNNVVLSSENGIEVILMGKGIGFQKHPGDLVDESVIEKRFHPEENLSVERMSSLISQADEKVSVTMSKIVQVFRENISGDFNPNLFFTLMDHVLFSIEQQKQGVTLVNPMKWEIKKIYPKEYQVSIKAIEIIRQELYSDFSEEETAFITLHFVNAQLGTNLDETAYKLTEMTNDILRIVKLSLNIEYDENSTFFQRFVTHIRYYLIRQGQEQTEQMTNSSMVALAFNSYPEEKEVAEHIKEYLYEQRGWIVNDMELMYLILHIGNLIAHSKVNQSDN
jgi:beta-glucoside operon transcriptional antiterminator